MAKLAKKGSEVIHLLRERQDKTAMRTKFWELAGSKLGDIMKLKK